MLRTSQSMKSISLLIFIISAHFSKSQLSTNLLDIIQDLGNSSVTVGDIIFSDDVQNLLISQGYTNVASTIDGLEKIETMFTKLNETLQLLSDENNECSRQLLLFYDGIMKSDEWAVKMLDATAKLQSGILAGNIMHVGNYDECLKVQAYVNSSEINGQYCTSYITLGSDQEIDQLTTDDIGTIKQSWGMCLPAVCDVASLKRIALLIEETWSLQYHFNFLEELCISTVYVEPYSTKAIVAICFFTIMGVVVLLSTFYDIFVFQKKNLQEPNLLIAFSYYTNGLKLLSTKKNPDSLHCLNGIRVISMIWIVAAHRYMYSVSSPLINLFDVVQWTNKALVVLIATANASVDTFFLISGLLVVYLYLLYKDKGKFVSLQMFYLHRILRLTPALAAMILLQATLLEYIGSGPFWSIPALYQKSCEDNWWSTLLYVQNYVAPKNVCIPQSWYLSVDTQLYFLSPLIFMPLIKWPRKTIKVLVGLIVVCTSANFFISWSKDLRPAYFQLDEDNMKYMYFPTHTRAVPFLIGNILGYILFKIRTTAAKINKIGIILLWISSLCVLILVAIYHKRMGKMDELGEVERAIDNSLLRLIWSLGMAVVIFLCVTGHGGIINRFLSSTVFTVLIRINYSAYLIHLLVILYQMGQVRTPLYESVIDNIYLFCGDYVISSILAVIWTLTFESPILVLEKIIFERRAREVPNPERYYTNNNNLNVVIISKLENGDSKLHQ